MGGIFHKRKGDMLFARYPMDKPERTVEVEGWPANVPRADDRPLIPANITSVEVSEQLHRILDDAIFQSSGTLSSLLRHTVENALAGNSEALSEKAIGTTALRRDNYSTSADSNVRVEFGRLRERLRRYYEEGGRNDSILIFFVRGYRPQFRRKRTIDSKRSLNDKAWTLYQEGRRLWAKRTPEPLFAAIECFKQSLQEDPRFAAALAALAECYTFLALSGLPPRQVVPLAKEYSRAALELDPDDPSAHAVCGFVACAYDWDWHEAEAEFELALALDAGSTSAYCWHASYLVAVGRFSEAIIQCRRAQATESSFSIVTSSHVAKILHVAGDHDAARILLVSLIDEAPGFFLTHWHLGLIMLEAGQCDTAIVELEMAVNLSGNIPSVLASLACARAISGQRDEARAILKHLIDRRASEYVAAPDIVAVFGSLDELDNAFAWLEHAYDERAVFLSWLRVWPLFRPLREDPRYAAMLARLSLPPLTE